MLKYVYGVSVGRAHRLRGGCGADSTIAIAVGDTLYFALSDGAGSSSLSHRVSDTLVYEALRLMIAGTLPYDAPHLLSAIVGEVFRGIDRRHLYATLVVGTYHKGTLKYATVGDSVALYRKDGMWHATPITKGEFANETVFVLSDGWKNFIYTGEETGIDAIVVSSDGLGGIYFYYKMREDGSWYIQPNDKYLTKLVGALKGGVLTFDNINELLKSDKLMDINDDDKSVVIAYGGV